MLYFDIDPWVYGIDSVSLYFDIGIIFLIFQALSSKDCERIQSLHQLWALHLEPFLPELSDILQTFINSSSMSLQQMLRRVCAQLADLSPALARLVAKRLLRTLLHAMERELERPDSDGEGGGRGGGSQEGKEGGADGEEMGEEVKRSPKFVHFILHDYYVVVID